MPGRGQPWKGVGKGNPDRIGTSAIADGSITEADLDSSVTAKLNSGGGIDLETTVLLIQEDFSYRSQELLSEKWTQNGTGTSQIPGNDTEINGTIGLTTGATEGTFRNIQIGEENGLLRQSRDANIKAGLSLDDHTNSVVTVGMMSEHAGGGSSRSAIQANWDDGVALIGDGTDTNWQAVSKSSSSGESTTVDTGVAIADFGVKIRIEFEAGVGTVFFINGSQVANITADLPADALKPNIAINTKVASTKTMDVDYCEVTAER